MPLSQGVGPAERLHEARETLKHLQELQQELTEKKRIMVEDFQRTAKKCKKLVRRAEKNYKQVLEARASWEVYEDLEQ